MAAGTHKVQTHICKGDVFVNELNKHYRVAHCSDSSIFCEPAGHSDAPLAFTVNEFEHEIKEDSLSRVFEISTDTEKLDSYRQKHFAKREPYLLSLASLANDGHSPTSTVTYQLLRNKVEKDFGTCWHPGKSTIAKWWKAYRDAGDNIKKSLPLTPAMPKRFDIASNEIVEHFATENWLDSNTPNVVRGYEAYKLYVRDLQVDSNSKVMVASESTFRRRLMENNELERIFKSGNHNEYKKAQRTLMRKIKTTRALERVELDRVHLSLALLDDETKQPIDGNVSIYAAIDCFTRIPVGLTVEFGKPEDTRGVLKLIKQIFVPTEETLNTCGKPEKLVVDNGSGFRADKTLHVMSNIGIEYIKTPTGQPWKKPFVESFFNTLRKEFVEGQPYKCSEGKLKIGIPGYIGKRTYVNSPPPEIETVKKAAQITVSEFMTALSDYLQVFVKSGHTSLNNMSPIELWHETQSKAPIEPIHYDDIQQHFRTEEEERTLNDRGTITQDYQTYFSLELKEIYKEINLVGDRGKPIKVTIKYDPDDAREITVIYKLPGETSNNALIVPHQELEGAEKPVSFEELNKNKAPILRRTPNMASFIIRKQTPRPYTSTKKTDDLVKSYTKHGSAEGLVKHKNKSKPLKTKNTVKADKKDTKPKKTKNKKQVNSGQYELWDE